VSPNSYRFNVGSIECIAVSDGTFTYPSDDFVAEEPPGTFDRALISHNLPHIALLIASAGEQLLHIADTVLHPILMEHPDWHTAFDLLADQSLATKRRLLDRAAAEKALVLAFHFPFPSLGYVVQKGQTWQWKPVEALG
jgi:hypothetical protein